MPRSIHFVPFRDDSSERVAALEQSDNVVSRQATHSPRSSAATLSLAALSRGARYGAVRLAVLGVGASLSIGPSNAGAAEREVAWARLAPFFSPPPAYANQLGSYPSPLKFYDGRPVKDARDWPKRRQEILARWHEAMGAWPPLLPAPKVDFREKTQRENFTQHAVSVEIAERHFTDGYLLVPDGRGPFPAVFVPFYEARTSIGLAGKTSDFAYRLARRGFVTLAIGSPGGDARQPDLGEATCQPLSFLAYVAASCHTVLASLPGVDPARIGIVGHSYGGKWAMFASCLYEKYACGVWSDPGIVFDDSRVNINYWEPWYLGHAPGKTRRPGPITPGNPAFGAYKVLRETGHDLTELHALMAPRPFLVSGGSEDRPGRWVAINHAIALNAFLGYKNRAALTNRPAHPPTAESNEIVYRFFEHFLKPGQTLK